MAEVTAALEGRKQELSEGRTVAVSAPEVDDWSDPDELETAVGYVELEEEDGIMDVTISDVEFTVRDADGEVETTVTRDVTVSVGTTMMELHDRVEEYESYLNEGMIDSIQNRSGYGYDLAKRLWPLAWGKAYYDRLVSNPGDRAFENVTPNDHVEVMANDARFTAQQEVFGTQDDYGNRVMAGPFLCMAYDLSDSALDLGDTYDFDGIADKLHPDDNVSSVDDLCAEGLVSPDGELPTMPTLEELIMGLLDNVDKSGTIQGHPFADVALQEMDADLSQNDLKSDMWGPLNETSRFTEDYLEDYFGESERSRVDYEGDLDGLQDITGAFDDIRENAININGTNDVIDDVYTVRSEFVDGSITRDGGTHPLPPELDSDEYDTENYTIEETRELTSRIDTNASIEKRTTDGSDTSLDRSLVSFEFKVEMRYTTERDWNYTNTNSSTDLTKSKSRTTTYTGSYELHGEFAPGLEVSSNRVDHVLNSGGQSGPIGTATNWDDAADDVTESFFGERVDDDTDLTSWLRTRESDIESYSDFRDAIKYETSYREDVVLSPNDRGRLHSWIMNDLRDVHLETIKEIEPVEAEIMDILNPSPESPMREIENHVRGIEIRYVNGTSDFENAPDLARMEARQVYFDNIRKYVDSMAAEHEQIAQGRENLMNDLLGNFLDDVNEIINGPMDLLDEILGSGEELLQDEGGASVDTPEVLNNVNIEVDGSPTYHSSQVAVNRTEVPAVRAAGDGPLEIDEDMDFAPMGAAYDNKIGLPGFPLLPWPPLFYLQVDAWEIQIEGEYARFEVQATSGDPSVTDTTTYIREDKDVTLETPDGGEHKLGSIDPIKYENGQTILVIVPAPQFLPKGAPGVGDNQRAGAPANLCSPLWGDIGSDFTGDPEPEEGCL
ncbi:hypothetical protein J0X25_18715 [Haloterrigena alkaliphila]|nr:hypothetical protein [Haloterrigena alkaliphila]QSW99373.2 hypothetical protein J0X25_18715 [Haloterrigena alkaliphila]